MVPANFSAEDCADASESYERIGPKTPPTPGRVGGLMRRVKTFASDLLVTIRLRRETPALTQLAQAFRAADIIRVVNLISTAARYAVLLEQRLLMEAGIGLQAALARYRAAHPRKRRAAAPPGDGAAARPDPVPETDPDSRAAARAARATASAERRQKARRTADGEPSVAQLHAAIRRRGVGAIIAEMCRSLGITSQHPLWPELAAAIRAFGGSTEELEEDEAAGTRWCSKTWLALPYPRKSPTYDFQSFIMEMRETNWAGFPEFRAPIAAPAATGPP